jgi:hypothetical protein
MGQNHENWLARQGQTVTALVSKNSISNQKSYQSAHESAYHKALLRLISQPMSHQEGKHKE